MLHIKVDIGLPSHPHIRRLAHRLECGRNEALGLLVSLYAWCFQFAKSGDIKEFSPAEIAGACEWQGDAAELVKALGAAGFVKNSKLIGWEEVAAYAVELERDRLRKKAQRASGIPQDVRRMSGGCPAPAAAAAAETATSQKQQGGKRRPHPTLEEMVTNYREAWNQNRASYRESFPAVDFELEWGKVENYVRRKPEQAASHLDELDTFFRLNWLPKSVRDYPRNGGTPGPPKKRVECDRCHGKGEERPGLACLKCHGPGYTWENVKPWEGGCDDIGQTPEEIAAEEASGR